MSEATTVTLGKAVGAKVLETPIASSTAGSQILDIFSDVNCTIASYDIREALIHVRVHIFGATQDGIRRVGRATEFPWRSVGMSLVSVPAAHLWFQSHRRKAMVERRCLNGPLI